MHSGNDPRHAKDLDQNLQGNPISKAREPGKGSAFVSSEAAIAAHYRSQGIPMRPVNAQPDSGKQSELGRGDGLAYERRLPNGQLGKTSKPTEFKAPKAAGWEAIRNNLIKAAGQRRAKGTATEPQNHQRFEAVHLDLRKTGGTTNDVRLAIQDLARRGKRLPNEIAVSFRNNDGKDEAIKTFNREMIAKIAKRAGATQVRQLPVAPRTPAKRSDYKSTTDKRAEKATRKNAVKDQARKASRKSVPEKPLAPSKKHTTQPAPKASIPKSKVSLQKSSLPIAGDAVPAKSDRSREKSNTLKAKNIKRTKAEKDKAAKPVKSAEKDKAAKPVKSAEKVAAAKAKPAKAKSAKSADKAKPVPAPRQLPRQPAPAPKNQAPAKAIAPPSPAPRQLPRQPGPAPKSAQVSNIPARSVGRPTAPSKAPSPTRSIPAARSTPPPVAKSATQPAPQRGPSRSK